MMIPRSAGTILLATFLTTGCLAHRAPHRVKASLEEQLGGRLVREGGMKLGWASTRLVASIAGPEDDRDDSLALGDLTGVAFAVYSREKGGKVGARLDPVRMGLGDWQTVVRIRSADEQVLVLAKFRGDVLHKMMVFTVDSDEVMIGSFRGKLEHALGAVVRGAEESGAAGARRAVNMNQVKNLDDPDAGHSVRGPEPAR